jgi:hypothetical protein
MPYGFGGRGGGRGGGFGGRGGWGFGFRGSSPPWPYVGRGRGGLPRCGYYLDPAAPGYGQVPYPMYPSAGEPPAATPYYPPQMTRDQELDFLGNQAEMLKAQLEEIEARTRDLEASEE